MVFGPKTGAAELFRSGSGMKFNLLLSAGLCALGLAGCGAVNDVAGTFISAGAKPLEVSADVFAAPVACPPMELRSNTFLIRRFERGREDQSDGLLYQATIEDWANSCTREDDGQRRIKLGLSGSLTPGPAWKGGQVLLPLRVAIVTSSDPDSRPIASEVLTVPVTLASGGPAEKWTLIEEKFVIGQDRSSKIVFGFDEGGR